MSDPDFTVRVTQISDNPDGSGDFKIEMSPPDKDNIVRWAILELLKQAIEEGKNLDPGKDNLEDA